MITDDSYISILQSSRSLCDVTTCYEEKNITIINFPYIETWEYQSKNAKNPVVQEEIIFSDILKKILKKEVK